MLNENYTIQKLKVSFLEEKKKKLDKYVYNSRAHAALHASLL